MAIKWTVFFRRVQSLILGGVSRYQPLAGNASQEAPASTIYREKREADPLKGRSQGGAWERGILGGVRAMRLVILAFMGLILSVNVRALPAERIQNPSPASPVSHPPLFKGGQGGYRDGIGNKSALPNSHRHPASTARHHPLRSWKIPGSRNRLAAGCLSFSKAGGYLKPSNGVKQSLPNLPAIRRVA